MPVNSETSLPSRSSSDIDTEKNSNDITSKEVTFDINDPLDAAQLSPIRKWYITLLASILVLNATLASSATSGILSGIIKRFDVSTEIALLTTSLYICGYVLGPFLWAPLSEVFGRRPIYIISYIPYIAFSLGCGLSKSIASLIIFRFLAGVCAAATLVLCPGTITDIWDSRRRGEAIALFSVCTMQGPSFAPIIGGFIVTTIGWRWMFHIITIFAAVLLILMVFTLPETYRPILLVKKAQEMRKKTGDNSYHAPLEKSDRTLMEILRVSFSRPFRMLFKEEIVFLASLYVAFVYGLLYLLFGAYPVVFQENHRFGHGVGGLPFIGLSLGYAIAACVQLWDAKREIKTPEDRLLITIMGGPALVVGLFWFAWTGTSSIHWIVPTFSGIPLGFAILVLFVGFINYLTDVYLAYAASVLAANTVLRSLAGAGFPLFTKQMFENLGVQHAGSILGGCAVFLAPMPFLFVKYGRGIRAKSKFTS